MKVRGVGPYRLEHCQTLCELTRCSETACITGNDTYQTNPASTKEYYKAEGMACDTCDMLVTGLALSLAIKDRSD